jgi:hypothetical protein
MVNSIIQKVKKIQQLKYIVRKASYVRSIAERLSKRKRDLLFFSPEVAYQRARRVLPESTGGNSTDKVGAFEREGLTYHKNVLSFPLIEGKVKDYAGGLIDNKTHSLIPESIYLNYRKTLSQELPEVNTSVLLNSNLPVITHPVLFGGMFWNNFGHFLLESLARLWAYDYVKELDPYILFYLHWIPPNYLEKKNYAYQALAGFNIPHNRILFTNKPVIINDILIPAQKYGYEYCKNPDADFMKFIQSFRYPHILPKGFESTDNVYVSRSKIPDGSGKPIGEKLFDDYLVSNGYTIFHPEFYTLYEQLTIYNRAKKIIFCDGGALHGCILLPDLKAEVAIIARRRDADYDCRDITDQFTGYHKEVHWIDAVKEQYQFGLDSWDAVSFVDWLEVSVQLQARGFVNNVFESFNKVDKHNLIRNELSRHIRSVSNKPAVTEFLMKLPG